MSSETPDLPVRQPRRVLFDELRSLLGRKGPFVTAYLPSATAEERRTSRDAIEAAAEVPDDLRAGLVDLVEGSDDEAAMVAALISFDGESVTRTFPEGPRAPLVEVGHLPRIAPLLEAEQRLLHHMLAIVDSQGLELLTVPRHGDPTIHRVGPAPISQIGRLIADAAKTTGTPLVILSGPDDTIDELHRIVISDVPIETEVRPLDESEGAGVDEVAELVVHEVADKRAKSTVDAVRLWRFEQAHGLAEADAAATIGALADGSARLLLVHDDPDDERQAWFGDDARRLAVDLEHARPIRDGEELLPARISDVLIRSAILQRCPVHVVPKVPESTLPGQMGAVIEPDLSEAMPLDS